MRLPSTDEPRETRRPFWPRAKDVIVWLLLLFIIVTVVGFVIPNWTGPDSQLGRMNRADQWIEANTEQIEALTAEHPSLANAKIIPFTAHRGSMRVILDEVSPEAQAALRVFLIETGPDLPIQYGNEVINAER